MNSISNHINPFKKENREKFREGVGNLAGTVIGRIGKEATILLRGNSDESASRVQVRLERSVSERFASRENVNRERPFYHAFLTSSEESSQNTSE